MNIGILGSGDVAKSLAVGFLAHGHKTMLGTRNPAKLKDWAVQNSKGGLGSFADAARFGELVGLRRSAKRALRTPGCFCVEFFEFGGVSVDLCERELLTQPARASRGRCHRSWPTGAAFGGPMQVVSGRWSPS
jgi:hypothetical protein